MNLHKLLYCSALMTIFIGIGIITQANIVHGATWYDQAIQSNGSVDSSITPSTYGAPPDISSGVPGFVPYNGVFTPIAAGNSLTLQRSGTNVGLVVTKATANQSGAIWSNQPIFDLSKQHQAISMDVLLKETGSYPGDGMAFALSGTPQTSLGSSGASLGVWGKEQFNAPGTTVTSALIQANVLRQQLTNSAVITLDTYRNQNTLDASISGLGGGIQYVGFGYPSLANMYTATKPDTGGTLWNTNLQFNSSQTSVPSDYPSDYSALPYRPYDTATLSSSSNNWHIFDINWDRNSNGGVLTYKINSLDGGNIVRQIPWTDAQIDTIFGAAAKKNLYVGFTGSTGSLMEANVLAFRSIPGIVNASGNVKLTRPADSTTVTNTTVLHTNDALNYHFSLNYDASSKQSWPASSSNTLTMYIPKSQYFVAAPKTIRMAGSDGSSATVTVDSSSATQFKLTGFGNFLQGTSKTITFDIPVTVDATVGNNSIPVGSTQSFSDNTGTMVGDNAQVQVTNPDQASDPYTIKYKIQNTGKPFVPPALPALETVPDLHFMNTPRFFLSGLAAANPTVSELIHGSYIHSDDVQQSANDSNTSNPPKLPYISSSDNLTDIIDPSNYNTKDPQLLTAAYNDLTLSTPTNPKLVINGNKTKSNWNLGLQLSPFKSTGAGQQTLPHPARIVFASLSQINSGAPASYLPKPTDATPPALVTDGASTPTTVLTSGTAQSMLSIGSNTSGDGGFNSQAFVGLLYFDQKLPTVQAGSYTSTATWTLSTTP